MPSIFKMCAPNSGARILMTTDRILEPIGFMAKKKKSADT